VLRIRDVYPGILIFTHPGSRISDPGSKNSNKREGRKKKILSYLFLKPQIPQNEKYFIFEKILVSFQRIIELFTQNFVNMLSNDGFGIRNPGSGKNLFRIPDSRSGSRGQKGTGSRIRIRNTGKKLLNFIS
jgi:hypothetical protein